MSTRSPTLSETIRRFIDANNEELRTCIPGAIASYDATKQRATVKPLVQQAYTDEDGNRQLTSFALVTGVPVVFPGAGGYRVTFPISDGSSTPATTGVLLFAERSIDKWLTGGGSEVDPEIDHTHYLADGVFIPGLNPFGAPLQSCPTDHATLGADNGVQIHLRSSIISIGDESGNDFVALAQKVLDNLNNLQTHFTALESVLVGPPVITEPGGGAPSALQAALKAAILAQPYPSPTSVAATQAKAQ